MAMNTGSVSCRMFIFCFTVALIFLCNAVTAVPEQELESMLTVLRTRGYNLFGNAITTSDVYYEVLAEASFTIFTPTDSSLFALDMIATASEYIATLRCHIVPRRLALADLRGLPSGSNLPTIVQNHDILIERRPVSDIITADGIEIVVPGLFYSTNIAIHGLGGIFSFKSQIGPRHRSSAPPPVAGQRRPPRPPANLYGNHISPPPLNPFAPPPENISINQGSPDDNHPQAPSPQTNLSDHVKSESPSAEGNDNRPILSPIPELTRSDRFSPVGSPIEALSPIGSLPDSLTGPPLASKSELPAPAEPKDNNPPAYSPSIHDMHPADAEGWALIRPAAPSPERAEGLPVGKSSSEEVSSNSPPTMLPLTEGMASEITATMTQIPWPFDPEALDCPVEGSAVSVGHVSIQPDYPFPQYPTSSRTCAGA